MIGPALGGVMDEMFGWHPPSGSFLPSEWAALALTGVGSGRDQCQPSTSMLRQFGAYPDGPTPDGSGGTR